MFERLTERSDAFDCIAIINPRDPEGLYELGDLDTDEDADLINAVADRLAAYEDSGLPPEQVQELAKAEADGRLVVLPCKVKDMVYYTLCGRIFPVTVKQFRTNALQEWKVVIAFDSNYKEILDCVDFGKTVFLTREEAEKAIGGGQ